MPKNKSQRLDYHDSKVRERKVVSRIPVVVAEPPSVPQSAGTANYAAARDQQPSGSQGLDSRTNQGAGREKAFSCWTFCLTKNRSGGVHVGFYFFFRIQRVTAKPCQESRGCWLNTSTTPCRLWTGRSAHGAGCNHAKPQECWTTATLRTATTREEVPKADFKQEVCLDVPPPVAQCLWACVGCRN